MLDHLSASQIQTFNICSAKWYFAKVEKVIVPSRSQLLIGSAFHASEGENYKQKIESESDMKVTDVCDIFGTQFDEGAHDVLWLPDEDKGELKDNGYSMVTEYHKVIAPKIQPKAVEENFEIAFKNEEFKFIGRIDLITDQSIIETKTKSRKPSGIDQDHKLQLTGYSAGYQVTKNQKLSARIDYAINKKSPEVVSYPVEITDSDIKYLVNVISMVRDAIEKGVVIPNRSSMMCSHKYCMYADVCEAKFGGSVRE